ncbi:MAG: pyridoxamine 5'-phosphate oxidase family protein [Candidatus Binatus sp.]|uniref:pyridoxamine 5'-phosphate oxidase family protein n=1 Tax=Candidatus Binatus sp. TaxID=2811406 RepID=UPI002716EF67|nr:pyridoxamine 5'-phosphate oxidase family protein [Candidatus Binatus sp.]MDO8431374.1 pyridoxamine 5'-phosphate oxidase family protein [Candidatus Binatus sp.]
MKSPRASLYAYLFGALIAMIAIATPIASATAAPFSQSNLEALSKSSYIYIATVRKDGNQSKAVPVWFIVSKDHRVLIETSPTSWKAKRISRGSPALVWIGSSSGPAFIGKAAIIKDTSVQDEVIEQYPKKYTLAWIGIARPSRAKIDREQIVVIQIEPIRELREGFQSQPGTPAPAIDEVPANAAAR